MPKKKAAKKAAKRREQETRTPVVVPPDKVIVYDDEEMARDEFRGEEVRFDAETPPGTTFQGLILGMFTNETGQFGESIGYNFLSTDGRKVTVWGSHVLDRLMPQYEPPTFLTITFKGVRGRTKTFKVTSSKKGLAEHRHLISEAGVKMSDYKWFEPTPF